ncbi:MAG: hypothetical protein H6558_00270 [Lewinellaceae bacterium]|nr:hypothetical protein [Lewinellaceae bacterium]
MKKLLLAIAFFGGILSAAKAQNDTPGKIWVEGQYLYVNIIDQGVLIFDNANPAAPRQEKWLPIPNCREIAVVNGILFANHYDDLISLDMQAFLEEDACKEIQRIEGVFPERADQDNIPVCRLATNGGLATPQGGSMSCFAIDDPSTPQYLYAINRNTIHAFNIDETGSIRKAGSPIMVSDEIETVFIEGAQLFLGARSGMHIYSLANPDQPRFVGRYSHMTGCDPVVVENGMAYVTIRNGNNCGQTVNQLHVVNIRNPASPSLIARFNMTNPHGLGVDQGKVFVCDGAAGLKILQADDPRALRQIGADPSVGNAYDVIVFPDSRQLIVVAGKSIIQYNYSSSLGRPRKISELVVEF